MPGGRNGGLTEEEKSHFEKHGYVVVRGVLTDSDFASFERDYCAMIDKKAQELCARGSIKSAHDDKPFAHRLAAIAAECSDLDFECDLSPWGLSLDTMHARVRGCFDFFFCERLLAVVESIVGPEITLNPIQHFRPFLPARAGKQAMVGAATLAPWHQDQGVTREEADSSDILTCWIPFVDVGSENGCLQVMPDCTHMGLLEHIKDPVLGTTVRPDLLPTMPQVDVTMRRGDLLFIHKFCPHRSQANTTTDIVRWSLDCRFQKTGTPTGRHFWPEFILQSKSDPSSVQRSYEDWCRRWVEALEASKGERWHRVAGDVGGSVGENHLAMGTDTKRYGRASLSPRKRLKTISD